MGATGGGVKVINGEAEVTGVLVEVVGVTGGGVKTTRGEVEVVGATCGVDGGVLWTGLKLGRPAKANPASERSSDAAVVVTTGGEWTTGGLGVGSTKGDNLGLGGDGAGDGGGGLLGLAPGVLTGGGVRLMPPLPVPKAKTAGESG